MVRRTVKHRMFAIIWLSGALLAGWLYYHWHIAKDYVGLVEIVSHPVAAREPGMVRDLLVEVKDPVQTGQLVAILDMTDLDTELRHLRSRLDTALALENANRSRFAMEIRRLKLQVNNANSAMAERLAEIAARQSELAGLNAEISRLQKAESAGLGHSRDLADLVVKRDSLNSYLRTLEKDLTSTGVLTDSATIPDTGGPDDEESLLNAMMAEARDRTDDILREILVAENRKRLRTVLSPCDGHVVEVMARPGDAVDAFSPVLTIMESASSYLNVYIPERSDFSVREGMGVDVYPVRTDAPGTTGRVAFVNPGYTQVPERLTVRGRVLWAHVVRVALESDHRLRPGEIVHVRIRDDNRRMTGGEACAAGLDSFPSRTTSRTEAGSAGGRPAPTGMILPPELISSTRFEPSGLVWHADIGRYIVVSDDTGIADTQSDHAPMVFLMDPEGRVEPVDVAGAESFNDLESVTRIDGTSFLVTASQSISRNGNRPADRTMMHRIRLHEGQFIVDGSLSLMEIILAATPPGQSSNLGLQAMDRDGLPVINIEGAAYRDGTLYLGLKQPVTDEGAIIWRLDGVDAVLASHNPAEGHLSRAGTVDLGQVSGRRRGISDLTFDAQGRLWALSTVPDAEDDRQTGGLHRIDRFPDGRMKAVTVTEFPGLKPEGLAFDDTGGAMIVFDTGGRTPVFLNGRRDNL